MKLAIVTDAWHPQVNGVVTTFTNIERELRAMGHSVEMVTPVGFRSVPCPTYPEIRLSRGARRGVARRLDTIRPQVVHIATEGPLGMAARRWCLKRSVPFSTSMHTRFPEYLEVRLGIPCRWTAAFLRWFHRPSRRLMVRSASQKKRLLKDGFGHITVWPGAVDTTVFRPGEPEPLNLPRPIAMYAGRVSTEKNIEAFLDLELPGSKVVVGDGPERDAMERRYPGVHFVGPKFGASLAAHLRAADVFVFPSRTDTFGLVMLEAMACGTPVAAFPVPGPNDVVRNGQTGVLDEDLRKAVFGALALDGDAGVEFAWDNDWRESAKRFLHHLPQPVDGARLRPRLSKLSRPADGVSP